MVLFRAVVRAFLQTFHLSPPTQRRESALYVQEGMLVALCCMLCAHAVGGTADPRVLNADASWPEGPVWHEGKLYYVEYGRSAVMVWDGRTNRRFWSEPGCGQSAVIATSRGEFLTTCYDNGTIGRFDARGRTLPPYTHDKDGNTFSGPNDFAPDGKGGIYFTASGDVSHGPVTDGKVFYIAADGSITQKITDLQNANGIAVSGDGKILYVVETDANRLLEFDIAADGSLSNRRVFVNLDELTGHRVHIWPDGVKIDSRGQIYIGQSPRELHAPLGGQIYVVDARAHLLRTLTLPSLQVPNFAFSPDEKTLYVTAVDEVDKPYRGKVYAIANADTPTDPDQWPAPGRDQNGTYYSPLRDIDVGNVSRLGFAWDYRTHSTRGLEATPLVIDGVMYTTGNFGRVYALDGATGRELWTYDPEVDGQWGRYACCDAVNRGVAAAGGRIYVGALDGWLHALDARTGKRLWKVDTFIGRSQHRPYTITGQPLIAGDEVIIGNGGGEFAGARGYVTAFDLVTGKLRWRFFTVPRDPALGPQDQPHLKTALATWDPHHPWNEGSSGNVWDGMAYDPVLKLVYIGTANPGPYNSHLDGRKGGDELYTASIVAIRADSGAMAWYYQTVPGDRWDYDSTQKMVLADVEIHGHQRQVLMQAAKNGFYYVIDRTNGELLSANNFAFVSWTRGIEPKSGRPILDPSTDFDRGPALLFPSEYGAHSWQPMAFDAARGLTFIPVIEAGNVELESSGLRAGYIDGQFTTPAFISESYDPAALMSLYGALPPLDELARGIQTNLKSRGFLRAWNVKDNRLAWEVKTATLWDGGVLATGGGLVFQGDGTGHMNAYAADTGRLMASIALGSSIMAAPMTYRIAGVQYIAVMAGLGGGSIGNPFDPATAAYRYGNEGRIIVLKLDGPKPKLPLLVAELPPPAEPPPRPSDAIQVANGEVLYNRYCGRCHIFGRGLLPDLRRITPATHRIFDLIVRGGAYGPKGMGRFDDVLSVADTDAIHAYLIDQAWQLREAPAAAAP